MYRRLVSNSAKRSIKKLPLAVREELFEKTKILEQNPFDGEKLSGSLSFLYSFHFSVNGIAYRTVYTVNEKRQEIIFHLAGIRENFYEKVKRLFR
ncbi:type II toxin-antitoxin system RelE/ParE family toxin [Candidatus Kaiserbacteria bacterium]|nr:type II toxin-antitoxin system RelE/ParE family toxin [Candidatus Kaiserbacteria bacterium]